AHEKPVIFYSIVIGLAGPLMVPTVPAIRAKFGYKRPEPIPLAYPIPQRPRREVKGYDDEP
ncbi:NADH-ubiquinone oxidoreductase subunit, partial [Stereum hirsutum FP-91666 SS1]|uniref:NADH-ubiquinone oxidoreductase subunit n=1 Tax=Stereum hirsutum (strain FP-91666) TaxID=721885 RepID=UPI00044495EE